ncbi:hypothetical protein L0222_24665, partial [bacterium]|nr:hypothetical protein [bacterium]
GSIRAPGFRDLRSHLARNKVFDSLVLVDLHEQSILVRGQARSLMPGMGGTAQAVVDSRSLIGHAFTPIRQLKEVLAKPPQNRKQP